MKPESLKHKELKEYIKKKYEKKFLVFEEVKIKGKIIDIVLIKDYKIIKVIECIVSQTMSNTLKKLDSINNKIKKEIVRIYKPKNPKARRIIEYIKMLGIEFTEIKREKLIQQSKIKKPFYF